MEKKQMIKNITTLLQDAEAVIFDMDGVILNSEPVHHKLIDRLAEPYGGFLTGEEYNTLIGKADHTLYDLLYRKYSIRETETELIETYKSMVAEELRLGRVPAVPGVFDLVCSLAQKGKKLAIASSSSSLNIRYSLKCAELEEIIQIYVSAEDVKHGKPDPDVYLKAAEKLGVKPDKCIGIEDSDPGLTAVKRAGMTAVGFRNPDSGNQTLEMADIIIDSFEGIQI